MYKPKTKREVRNEKHRIAHKIIMRIRRRGGIVYPEDWNEMPVFTPRPARKMRPYGIKRPDDPGHCKGSARNCAKRIIRQALKEYYEEVSNAA